ncbi:hypothetical protein HPP92_002102 [Vanilla planifolia]|uniref:Peptidyl-prolyl cis-trans isomerase Pin1 n=1 Tax=Vanilla planifolia TaxID=51239 RepID=A0A835VI61_VANPL|nr:hypothetical protein HPP92_002102 [Vanilla planifolia]
MAPPPPYGRRLPRRPPPAAPSAACRAVRRLPRRPPRSRRPNDRVRPSEQTSARVARARRPHQPADPRGLAKTTRQLRLAGKRGLRGQRGTGGGASGVLRWRAFDGSGHIRIPRGSAIDCALYGAEGREALRPPFLLHGNPISVSERCREMVTEVGCKTPSTKIEKYGELPSRKRPSRPSGEVGEGQPEGGKRRREKKLAAGMSAAGQDRIRASHILIKHEGSRRKSSWKDPDGHVISSTSREKAIELIMELRGEIATGRALFEDLAARHSDCSSAKRGGDLGRFGKGQMQKPFEQAAFSLKVGELSDIVETDSGVHLILRTG